MGLSLGFFLGSGGSSAGHEGVEGGGARRHDSCRIRVRRVAGFEDGGGFGREERGNKRRESSRRESENETRRVNGVGYTAGQGREHQLNGIC